MDRFTTPVFSSMLVVFALLLLQVHAANAALTLSYCSSQNTGSDNEAKYWTWQSNGWCFDQCKGDYALGVVQGNNCWCSDYIPEDQVDTGDCSMNCPGFPEEKCGSSDGKLFGYVALEKKPSGTQAASQPQPTSANPSAPPSPISSPKETPPPEPATVVQTVTEQASVVTLTPSEKPSSAAPTTFQTSASSADHTDEPTQAPVTTIRIVTVGGGGVVTQTVVSGGASTNNPPIPENQQNQKKSTPVGAIVGGVLGGIALIGLIVGAIFFFLWRQRKQQPDDGDQSGVQRNTSTMSKSGLLRTEQVQQYPPKIATNFNRNSRMMHDGDSISPVSGSDRRSSRPYIFDQRLNPSAIMTFDNTSRGSFASMDDSRDYGRTLNIRNPDPDPHT